MDPRNTMMNGRPPKILGSTQQEDLGGDRKSVFVCDFAVHIALTPIQSGIAKGSLTLPTTSYCMGSERGYLGLI